MPSEKTTKKIQVEVVLTTINKLVPNENNPRTIRDKSFEKLKSSIKQSYGFLFVKPIIVDENYMILAGNQRYKACKELNIEEVPVSIFTQEIAKLSSDKPYEEQCKELIVKDNVSAGDWDMDMLGEQYEFLQLDDWGVDKLPKFDELPSLEEEKLDNYAIKYEIVFNNEGEQDRWYRFMKKLKDNYPDFDTFSERLIQFLEDSDYA